MPDPKTGKETPAAPPPAKTPSAIAASRAVIAGQAQQTLDLLHRRLADIEARVTNRASTFLTLAQSNEAQARIQNSPQLKAQLPILVASLQKIAAASQTSQNARSQALSGVQAKLQSFAQGKG